MAILVTGGAGYIGSHTCVELLNSGYEVVIFDNLINSSEKVIGRIKEITGKNLKFYIGDLLNKDEVEEVFKKENIEAVIHFAGLKAVGESVEKPLLYYKNNIIGTINLCEIMDKYGIKDIIFSSSATVYGEPKTVPIKEDFPLSVKNPYGRTKLMIEDIFRDLNNSCNDWNVILLRYFNPIGAHDSGKIGDNPKDIPNNLVPYITQVAIGKLECLSVFGDDYDTFDGTGVRDYIHVVDLAIGHVRALEKLKDKEGVLVYNLGTGKGYSVLDLINAFSKVCKKSINYKIVPRRKGDAAVCYSDPTKANRELKWVCERDLIKMCEDAWRWQSKNPNGYE